MLMTVEELKKYIQTDVADEVLAAKLSALELLIRRYTNNNFQKVSYRRVADIVGGMFVVEALTPFNVGDTVQVTGFMKEGLYTVTEATDSTFKVAEAVIDDANVLVTKVEYPIDVKLGAVKLLEWELNNGDKVGIASETISRHSVSYVDLNANSVAGYPKALMDFLKLYRKARF